MMDLKAELLFDLSLNLDRANTQDVGAGPHGHRRIVPVSGGSFAGPKLKGEVLPIGADWLLLRPDGVKQIDARITLRTDDGELIYTAYRGIDTGSPEVAERLARGETVDPSEYYFRIQPYFETGSQKYGWMNQIVSVGFGKRTGLSLGYTVYIVLYNADVQEGNMPTKTLSVTAAAEAAIAVERPTTDGAIAILNLRAQIDGQRQQAASGRLNVTGRAGLIELITLRGNLLGHIASYELAAELAEELVHDAPADRYAFFARATTRATFHRFTDALDDLDTAERFGMDDSAVDGERAAIFQATGGYDEALAIREKAAERRAGFETLGALAGLFAELGEITTAEKLLGESRDRYRGVSPFPLAFLDFQFGLMWMEHGQFVKARTWFDAACRRVPAYAAAQGHLAEVEAELGESETAAARLYPLTASSDDPDYAAQLSRILGDAGRADESSGWRQLAAARYDELVERHPEAFADHAAEFWLEAGADPNRALWLAERNLEIRRTPRAHKLFARAAHAVERAPARHPDRHGDAEEGLR